MEYWLIELLVFLPGILLLGAITSYEDIKQGKIRNKWIIFAIVYAILAYIFLISYLKISGQEVRLIYFRDVLINSGIAVVLGFILWQTKLWSAADGKIFFAYALLLPLGFYSNSYYDIFPSFVLLSNTFVPFFIYSVFYLILFAPWKIKKEGLSKTKIRDIIIIVSSMFVITWITRLFVGLNFGFLAMLLIVIIALFILNKILKGKILGFFIFLSIVRIILDYKYITTPGFIREFLPLVSFLFLLILLVNLASLVYTQKIRIKELRKGMIFVNNPQEKSLLKELEEIFLEQRAEGITDKDIALIKKLNKNNLNAKIEIKRTFPFAPFILIGVILTIIFAGDSISSIIKFIYSLM
jgi:hypothetical protein